MLNVDLDKAAKIIREELFAPLGVTPPEWPIKPSVPREWGLPPSIMVRGATEHNSKVIVVNLKAFTNKLDAAATLTHEIAHTVIGSREGGYDPMSFDRRDPMAGHGPDWRALIDRVGLSLTGVGSITRPTPKFEEFFRAHLEGRI